MAAYNAETALARALDGRYARAGDEAYALIREALTASGDILPGHSQLLIRLDPLTAPRRTQALAALCDQLNQTASPLPRHRSRPALRVESHPKPCIKHLPMSGVLRPGTSGDCRLAAGRRLAVQHGVAAGQAPLALVEGPYVVVAAIAPEDRDPGRVEGRKRCVGTAADPVPLEYSIESLTCAFASRRDVVLVSLPGAAGWSRWWPSPTETTPRAGLDGRPPGAAGVRVRAPAACTPRRSRPSRRRGHRSPRSPEAMAMRSGSLPRRPANRTPNSCRTPAGFRLRPRCPRARVSRAELVVLRPGTP